MWQNLPINSVACVRFIVKFTSRNGLKILQKLIRYNSRGNNPVKPLKLCTGYFWLIWKHSHTNNTGNKPAGDHCAVWSWFNDKWVSATHAVWLLCCSKPLFCFYKHVFQWFSFSITDQGWLLEYISEYLYLRVPFVHDYAFQSLVLTVEWNCPTQRVVVPSAIFDFSFRASFLSLHLTSRRVFSTICSG